MGAKGTWVNELPNILWASWTTPKTGSGESPFNMAYDAKAILPLEIVFLTPRVENFDKVAFEEQL